MVSHARGSRGSLAGGFIPTADNLHGIWKRNSCGHKPRDVVAEGKEPCSSTDSLKLQIFKAEQR